MTQQTNGMPDLNYSEENFHDLYEACLAALGVMATLDQDKGWVREISSVIQKALTKAK